VTVFSELIACRTCFDRALIEDAAVSDWLRFGEENNMHLLIALMLIKHVPPARVGYWKDNSGESDFMLVGTLGGGEHDRVCGLVSKSDDGWDVITLRSGGAIKGVDGKADTFDQAKFQVEQDCR
jgi:hypothetical protein